MTRYCKKLRQKGLATAMGVALSAIPALATGVRDRTEAPRAIITIPTPQSANLLQLRGIGGRGTALIQAGDECHSMPVRLVAGDFNGQQVNVREGEPIVLEVRDPTVVQALLRGTDIVSDEATVSADPTDRTASILLLSGLGEGTGFVINPGRSFVADVFGAHISAITCDVFEKGASRRTSGQSNG